MNSMISAHQIAELTRQALTQGFIREEDTAVMIHDLGFLRNRIGYLKSCFPPDTLHGLAIKSNPLLQILQFTRTPGTGVEAATTGEIAIALKAGYTPSQIVYDSPVKTVADLRWALDLGVLVNCDNLDELKRVDFLLKTSGSPSSIGVRINPQVGMGTIAESSVAGEYSKFGVPIRTRRHELAQAFLKHPWLTGVHLHVGSQGCAMSMLVEGVGILYDFVQEVNDLRKTAGMPLIDTFDIGGGLPVRYLPDSDPPRMEDYVAALRERAPGLFGGMGAGGHGNGFRVITEFGRWVFVNSGFTVSRVEYVKHDPGIRTAMIHVGADLFVRECLNPADWKHQFSVLNRNGHLKEGTDPVPCNLAGPLCFAGDILARQLRLPGVEEGDYIVVHDTGGYTFSMWSRYNSRQTPRILGWLDGTFTILREREGLEEVVGWWKT